jgi:SNF2 family DNA or RNA helicase
MCKLINHSLIIDEAHHAVNGSTELFMAILESRASKKFLLTGPPLRSIIENILSFFKILRVDVFSNRKLFCKVSALLP